MSDLNSQIANIGSIIEALRTGTEGFGKTAYWFRGHADAAWSLVPSVHRNYDRDGERNLIGRFQAGAGTRHLNCPELKDAASWLCLAQHNGLPTRLLDWTPSLNIALYFAIAHDPKPNADGALWILVPSGLNGTFSSSSVTHVLHGPDTEKLAHGPFDPAVPSETKVLAAIAHNVDPRMMLQQGTFTIHGDSTPLESIKQASPFLRKLVIPKKAKETISEELWVLGVRRSLVFPDLSNFALDLANDHRLIQKKPSQ